MAQTQIAVLLDSLRCVDLSEVPTCEHALTVNRLGSWVGSHNRPRGSKLPETVGAIHELAMTCLQGIFGLGTCPCHLRGQPSQSMTSLG